MCPWWVGESGPELELPQALVGPASGLQVCAHGLLHGKLKRSCPNWLKELQPLTHALYVQTPHASDSVVGAGLGITVGPDVTAAGVGASVHPGSAVLLVVQPKASVSPGVCRNKLQ